MVQSEPGFRPSLPLGLVLPRTANDCAHEAGSMQEIQSRDAKAPLSARVGQTW